VHCRCISNSVRHLHGFPWLAALLPGTSSGTVCISWVHHSLAPYVSAVQRYSEWDFSRRWLCKIKHANHLHFYIHGRNQQL